jgi:ferredoxin
MKPVIEPDLCIGDGVCEDLCPNVFQIGDDGLAHVIDDSPSEEEFSCLADAESACPTSAITIEEA